MLFSRAAADQTERQIYISAAVLEVELGRELEHGTDVLNLIDELDVGEGRRVKLADCVVSGMAGLKIVPENVGLNRGAPSWLFLNACIEALEETQSCVLMSRPFVFTADGERATISSGDRVVVPTAGDISPVVEFRTVGLDLDILPTIRGDLIELKIGYANSRRDQSGVISEQQLEAQIEVGEGEIIVLGGVLEDRAFKRRALGSIPIVKRFFGSGRRSYESLIVFQTTIIHPEDRSDEILPGKPTRLFSSELLEERCRDPELMPRHSDRTRRRSARGWANKGR